ncbi:MAG: methyltransferase domain-containing protein [Solirubrobacterales bacterium]|nr:methyltransferase domain-containing protein [Solirubrobacterales bacterium]
MDKAAVELLICPHCGGELRENGASLICSKGHTMNIARQGYVSLLGRDSGTHTADSAEMVAARARFLESGRFQPLVEALVASANSGRDATAESTGAVIDLGCGTGYYLSAVLEARPGSTGIGIDNSKFAARRAARCHERAGAVVADIWDEIPVKDGAAELVLNVFAPRNGEEIERILAPGGRLVVVTPQAGHLAELIERFGMISVDPDKEERLGRSLGPLAGAAESRELEWSMSLSRSEVRDLVEMGPSAGRMEAAEMETALQELEEETVVTAAVTVTTTTKEERQ